MSHCCVWLCMLYTPQRGWGRRRFPLPKEGCICRGIAGVGRGSLRFPGRCHSAAFILVLPFQTVSDRNIPQSRHAHIHVASRVQRTRTLCCSLHPLLTSGCLSSRVGAPQPAHPSPAVALFPGACSGDVRGDPHLCTGALSPFPTVARSDAGLKTMGCQGQERVLLLGGC